MRHDTLGASDPGDLDRQKRIEDMRQALDEVHKFIEETMNALGKKVIPGEEKIQTCQKRFIDFVKDYAPALEEAETFIPARLLFAALFFTITLVEDKAPMDELKRVLCDEIDGHLDALAREIEGTGKDNDQEIMTLVNIFIHNGTSEQKERGLAVVLDHKKFLSSWLSEDEINEIDAAECIYTVFRYGTPEQQKEVAVIIRRALRANIPSYMSDKIFDFVLTLNDRYTPELAHFVEDLLLRKEWKLADMSIIEAWQESASKRDAPITDNFRAIQRLEAQRRGITHTLCKEFGIFNFFRYPEDVLIRQFDERENIEKPYGVVLYPKSDWSGALYSRKGVFDEFFEKLQDAYALRIVECGSRIDVVRFLLKLNARYGQEQKISFAIIGAHGNKDLFEFGSDEERGQIKTEHLTGTGTQQISSFFTNNATIIIDSCLTGAKSGIAQVLSLALGLRFISPDGVTSMKSITPRFVRPPKNPATGERSKVGIRFFVKYKGAHAQTYVKGVKVT